MAGSRPRGSVCLWTYKTLYKQEIKIIECSEAKAKINSKIKNNSHIYWFPFLPFFSSMSTIPPNRILCQFAKFPNFSCICGLEKLTRVKGFSQKKPKYRGYFTIFLNSPGNHKIIIPDYLIWLF